MANDIRDILKGLDADHRAVYAETRTTMRRAYLYAHSKILPIDQYEEKDDAFLDLIDIQTALLFDRAGTFNHVDGHLSSDTAKTLTDKVTESAATAMMKDKGWGK